MSDQIVKRDSVLENIEIVDLANNNKGIAKIGKNVIFVDKTIPGDVVDFQIRKKRKGIFEAVVLNYKKLSTKRIAPVCNHFGDCGGCKIQNMNYEEQLLLKQKMVEDSLTRIAKLKNLEINPILGSSETEFYRNKLEYSFSNRRWLTEAEVNSKEEITNRNALGFHAPGRFDRIIDIQKCYLQEDISNQIRNKLRDFALKNEYTFYDPIEQVGLLRNIIIRTATTGDVMAIMVFGDTVQKDISKTMSFISDEFEEITSLFYIINTKPNDSIFDLSPVFYRGKPHIREKIEHIEVLLGPKSFYQTNSKQAVNLYSLTREFADIQSTDNVYDLYSGVGSIGLYLAKDARKVVGIETVQEAVEDAHINKSHNGIENASFYVGQVEKELNDEFIAEHGEPNVVIVDPPRSGLHKNVIEAIIKVKPNKVVYVSCNPSTQARDLQLFEDHFSVERVQPVDMFPHTLHVENIVLLKSKN